LGKKCQKTAGRDFFDSHCTSALSFFAFFITRRQPHTVCTQQVPGSGDVWTVA